MIAMTPESSKKGNSEGKLKWRRGHIDIGEYMRE